MNVVKAFNGTLILAVVFMVISLIYLSRNRQDTVSETRRTHTKSNPIIRSALRPFLHPDAKDQDHESGSPEDGRRFLSSDKKTKGEHSQEGLGIDKNMRIRDHTVRNITRPMEEISRLGNISTLEVNAPEVRGQSSVCKEQRSILLLKTHKTGSSTLQNVLYRFGDVRDLTFAVPVSDVYMGCPTKFKPSFAMRSPTGTFDILANHARFHKENMKQVMAPGAKFITILRYPPKQFESMYSFYQMERKFKCSFETFALSPWTIYEKNSQENPRHSARNPMLYDLGLESSKMEDQAEIDRWVEYLEESFDLVLIAEHLQESLLLLKDMMCWTFDDITYFTSNARSGMLVKNLSTETENSLLDWLSGDVQLYQHFSEVLRRKIEEYGAERMATDVEELTRRNDELKKHCVQGKKKVQEMGGRTVIERYVLRPEVEGDMQCKRITYPAVDYLHILKNKMKLKRPGKKRVVKSTG